MRDIRAILAANVAALMRYAADRQTGEPVSRNALARASGLSRTTIQRVVNADESAAAIDTVCAIAAAYKLHAWQLLVPGLDPSNPPVILITDTERQLHERLRQVAREFERHLAAEPASQGAPEGPDSHRAREPSPDAPAPRAGGKPRTSGKPHATRNHSR